MDFSSSRLDSDGEVQSLYAHSPNDDALTNLDDPKTGEVQSVCRFGC